MGSVAKAVEKPFRTGASSQARALEEQARQQAEQNRILEEQNAAAVRRAQEQALQAKNQQTLAANQAAVAAQTVAETPAPAEIVAGGTATINTKRRRTGATGLSTALGVR